MKIFKVITSLLCFACTADAFSTGTSTTRAIGYRNCTMTCTDCSTSSTSHNELPPCELVVAQPLAKSPTPYICGDFEELIMELAT